MESVERNAEDMTKGTENDKIKLTIRMAYGFRNIDNLIALICLRCGGRVIYLPGRAPRMMI